MTKPDGGKPEVLDKLDKVNRELAQVVGSMVTREAFELEMRTLATKMDGINKRIDDWRDSTKTYFMVMGAVIAVVGITAPVVIVLLARRIAA